MQNFENVKNIYIYVGNVKMLRKTDEKQETEKNCLVLKEFDRW